MTRQAGVSTVEGKATVSAALSIPPEWHALNLERLGDTPWMRQQIDARLDTSSEEGGDLATTLADLLGGVADNGVVFAAVCMPGEGQSIDLSAVTLALRSRVTAGSEEPAKPQDQAPAPADGESLALGDTSRMQTEPGASQNAVALPAGPAARIESFDLLKVDAPLKEAPVFCVEYAVAIPHDRRVAVLTFTTIAPSDTDALRTQFAEIASTLAFS